LRAIRRTGKLAHNLVYQFNDNKRSVTVGSLDLHTLTAAYQSGQLRPHDVVRAVHERILTRGEDHVWISRASLAELTARADALEQQRAAGATLPLFGIPFAVKDNIDVAGVATTAACPAYAYLPSETATVVQRLLDAGAIYIGKTNLDQFATGLVGTRSPYGICANAFNPNYVSGGSSAGSAVAVAAGLASFSLGTDTAGSGRVPAAFNNLIGLKPTRGVVSTQGVIPACRSLDCVSVFALTCADARKVLDVVGAYDARDPYSRHVPLSSGNWNGTAPFRFGVPRAAQLEFFGDDAARDLYAQSLVRLEALGGTRVDIDYAPFRAAALLLYEGPWVAERVAAIREFVSEQPESLHPVVREIFDKAQNFDAIDTFQAQQQLVELRRVTEAEWKRMDVLALPTAPTIYSIEQVTAEPIRHNSDLGYYTNFVNLLDLAALALPAGFRPDGLPLGLTLIAPAFQDAALCALGARFHQRLGGKLGATAHALPVTEALAPPNNTVRVAVVGAHLSGQPLNKQLVERNARLVKSCRTAKDYKLFALRGTVPPKPGLIFQPGNGGNGLDVEVWEMSAEHFGTFVALIPSPLGIGTLTLDSGEQVKGFICEPYAIADATDITHFGGWRAYLASLSTTSPVTAKS
jgi:allophanate hydrolase